LAIILVIKYSNYYTIFAVKDISEEVKHNIRKFSPTVVDTHNKKRGHSANRHTPVSVVSIGYCVVEYSCK